MKTNSLLYSLLISFSFLSLYSCNNENGKVPSNNGKSTAYFDYFNYKGEDDFYTNNPLSSSGNFYNPILPGWYSDPSICSNGEDYFLVTSTFVYYPGVPIFHSKDLVNWKQIGHVLDRPSQLINFEGQGTSGGIFAPAIAYNPHNQTYYMITTNVGAGNFFVKTKDPFGSWSEPVFLPEVGGIDPAFFFDEDGKAYIVNNDAPDGAALYDGHRAIRICEFDVTTEKVISPGKMIVNGGVKPQENPIWIEGPHLYKINGRYFLMAAEGGTSSGHSEVIFTSDSPMGTFIPYEKNPILTQRHLDPDRVNPITCVGHADLIRDKAGDWWAVFLGCRPINGKFENLGRETFMIPVRWSEDGYPYMTKGDELVPMQLERKNVVRKSEIPCGNFEKNDNFNSESLNPEWITLRAPATGLYSLTINSGFLSLTCSNVSASEKSTPAFIARRLQHHKFECETKMFFQPSDMESAGMLLYKDEKHQYFLSVRKSDNERKVSLEKIGDSGNQIIATQKIMNENEPVFLKIISSGLAFDFCYAITDGEWLTLAKNVDAYYLSTQNAGGFTGTVIGMYATKN